MENATTDLVKIFRIKRKIKSKLSSRLKFISRKDELIVLGLLMASGSRAHIQSQYIVCVLAGKSILMAVSFENLTYKLTYVFKISILCFFHKFKYLCKYFTITIFTKKVHCCDIPLTFPTYISRSGILVLFYITQQYIPDIIIQELTRFRQSELLQLQSFARSASVAHVGQCKLLS